MLSYLHVKNLAIIEEVEVEFSDHLNIVTGETGAGKSIILGSIQLALGAKASKEMIRKGADTALVELIFQLEETVAKQLTEQYDLPIEDGTLIITRKITAGKSICKINGEIVPIRVLRQVGETCIRIHGQQDQQTLLHTSDQLQILDHYAKQELEEKKKKYEEKFQAYVSQKQFVDSITMEEQQRNQTMAFLQYEKKELEEADLKEEEEEMLPQKYEQLSHWNKIQQTLSEVEQLFHQEGRSISDLFGIAMKKIEKLQQYEERLQSLCLQLETLDGLYCDFEREISELACAFVLNEEEWEKVENRMHQVNELKRKYGNSISDILQHQAEVEKKLEQYEHYEQYREEQLQKQEQLYQELQKQGKEISKIRKQKAVQLEQALIKALTDLNFLEVRFSILLEEKEQWSKQGIDEVTFTIATNPGEPLQPLSKIASGGELSRIMLALQSILAHMHQVHTLIFDEIDTGISGRTAQKVSEKLAQIAKDNQVICITHLPQIAAMADAHYKIEKQTDGARTTTKLFSLKEEEMIQELARMLGGTKVTETVLKNAKEMKKLATNTKIY